VSKVPSRLENLYNLHKTQCFLGILNVKIE
jgi:hypothetical protein